MSPLDSGSEIVEWMALRRVHAGGVSTLKGDYFQHGHPISGEVVPALDRLIQDGCLVLGRLGPNGHRTVCVTVAGQSRYAELRQAFHG